MSNEPSQNTDYEKYLIENNDYTYYQDRLILQTNLILVNPNEETEFYGVLVGNVVDEIKNVNTIHEAKDIIALKKHDWYIVVERDAHFSETLFVQLMMRLDSINAGISTGDVHVISQEQLLDNILIEKDLRKYEDVDRPHCSDSTTD